MEKTEFTVSLWVSETQEPAAKITVRAKMPLGAMVLAMQMTRISSAEYVLVQWSDGEDTLETDFYHAKIQGGQLTYDRAVG